MLVRDPADHPVFLADGRAVARARRDWNLRVGLFNEICKFAPGLRAAALLGLCAVAACGQGFSLRPPAGELMTVSVIDGHSVRDFAPPDAPYRRISDWVSANRTGWSQFMGAPPPSGTMVVYGDVSLQFVDHRVLARAPTGIYEKATTVSMELMLR